MFEVAHNGEEALTWSGDEIPEGESAIVIGELSCSFEDHRLKRADTQPFYSQPTINRE